MDDKDNVIHLPTGAAPTRAVSHPALATAGVAPSGSSEGSTVDEAAPSLDQHAAPKLMTVYPGKIGGPNYVLAEGFGDPETLFNSREWLWKTLEAAGAKIDGGGVGMGQCDIDFTLEGCRFNVSLRPIEPPPKVPSK